jgi:hypothetical protein
MKIKIIGFLVCILLIATAVPVLGTSNEKGPNIDVDIEGGLGITLIFTNKGNETLTDIEWNFTVNSSLFGLGILKSGKEKSGIIPILEPGASNQTKIYPFGFGFFILQLKLNIYEGAGEILAAFIGFIIFRIPLFLFE